MDRNLQYNIRSLGSKISDVRAQARQEGRPLLQAEQDLVNQMGEALHELKSQPVGGPLTMQNSINRGDVGGRPYGNLGEQLLAVRSAGIPGGQIDNRLHLLNAAATGLNETVASDGSFLVQSDFSNELLSSLYETGILAKLCKRIQISSNSNSIKINAFDETSRVSTRFGGVVGYWMAEAEEKTKSKPKFRQLELNLHKLAGICYATDELLQDATALNTVIQTAFVSEFGFLIDDAILRGTGAGQPLGLLNSGCLVSVTKETGQKAATIVAENVIKMWSRLLPGSEARAIWLVNKNCLNQLLTLSLSVGTGGVPLYMPANSLAGVPYQSLFGRPVLFCEQASALGTVGDIILADLTNGYVLAEKGGIQADMSIHVRFVYGENVFRFIYRIDGQPVLASPLTPYKGGAGDTLSYFVALETRA